MQECYHPQIVFDDPVFSHLNGKEAKAMWHMLLSTSTDLKITFDGIQDDGERGRCRLEAFYSFSKTGRKVHNKINALFSFQDGLISRHSDSFDLWKWSSMALGPLGLLLGWTPWLQRKIRGMAARNLKQFIDKNPAYQ